MEDSVTQSELNTVINNLNSNIVNTANNITNNLVKTANNITNNLVGTTNNLQSQISLNVNNLNSIEEKILIDQIFGRTSSLGNGTITIGLGDLTFDPDDPNVFTRDENGLLPIDLSTGLPQFSAAGNEFGQMEIQFYYSYIGNLSDVGGYQLLSIDNSSEIVFTDGSVNYNGSIGELNYTSVTSTHVNATVARHNSQLGQQALEYWNGTWAEKNGYGDTPSRTVIMFSAFPLWNGLQSLPLSQISTSFGSLAGQFVIMIFTIKNTEGFLSWFKDELVPFCKSLNLYIYANSPTSHGVDLGGDRHNLKWGEDKTKGYGTHTLFFGGSPELNSTRVTKNGLDDIRASLKLHSEEVFTQITEQAARGPFAPPQDPSNLNDRSYLDVVYVSEPLDQIGAGLTAARLIASDAAQELVVGQARYAGSFPSMLTKFSNVPSGRSLMMIQPMNYMSLLNLVGVSSPVTSANYASGFMFLDKTGSTAEPNGDHIANLYESPIGEPGPLLTYFQKKLDERSDALGEDRMYIFPVARNPGSGVGFSSREITLDENGTLDLSWMNARTSGDFGAFLQRFGATQIDGIGGNQIVSKLADSTINFAEFSSPFLNDSVGLHDQTHAPYYYKDSIQEFAAFYMVFINAPWWDTLSAEQIKAFHTERRTLMAQGYAEALAKNTTLLDGLSERGIQVRNLPTDVLTVMRTEWNSYVTERTDPSNDIYDIEWNEVYNIITSTTQQELQNTLIQKTFDAQYEDAHFKFGILDLLLLTQGLKAEFEQYWSAKLNAPVTVQAFASNTLIRDAMLAGTIDFAYMNTAGFATADANLPDTFEAIGRLDTNAYYTILVSKTVSSLAELKDLENPKIQLGNRGSTSTDLWPRTYLPGELGVSDLSDFTIVNTPDDQSGTLVPLAEMYTSNVDAAFVVAFDPTASVAPVDYTEAGANSIGIFIYSVFDETTRPAYLANFNSLTDDAFINNSNSFAGVNKLVTLPPIKEPPLAMRIEAFSADRRAVLRDLDNWNQLPPGVYSSLFSGNDKPITATTNAFYSDVLP